MATQLIGSMTFGVCDIFALSATAKSVGTISIRNLWENYQQNATQRCKANKVRSKERVEMEIDKKLYVYIYLYTTCE